jgi:hypothetical protein
MKNNTRLAKAFFKLFDMERFHTYVVTKYDLSVQGRFSSELEEEILSHKFDVLETYDHGHNHFVNYTRNIITITLVSPLQMITNTK